MVSYFKHKLVIVPHNLTNKFQSLDMSVNQAAKRFISNTFNRWYVERASKQSSKEIASGDVKVSLKLSDLKSLQAKWIADTYNHLRKQSDSIIKCFDAAGITETIKFENDFFHKSRKSFRRTEAKTFVKAFAFVDCFK